ncbi:hypothetical protein KVR01_006007 [Diaporthe batatas]|uniref:uncharacterized protein n=1 Tax=Diaporthe batatas TaxID=748121 RepID=UPI001D057749|nr:uncharacterized protein KVR01_006007 [Diaporthe batatas]KAG8164089.1 hypothetical protein KVR01_006007 [Diaporthe batatas]
MSADGDQDSVDWENLSDREYQRALFREYELKQKSNFNEAVEVHDESTNDANDALPVPSEKAGDNESNGTRCSDKASSVNVQPWQYPPAPLQTLGLSRRNGWSDFVDYDVITVHGVRDDHQTVWTNKQDGSSWIERVLFRDLSIRQLDYVYGTGNSARIYDPSADGISTEANDLLKSLAQDRAQLGFTEAHRPIIWICHDLGGSIVKKALINAIHNEPEPGSQDGPVHSLHIRTIYRRLPLLTSSIIFLACPQGNKSEELKDQLFTLLNLPGVPIRTQIQNKVANLSRQIEAIDLEFLETKVLDHAVIVNIGTADAEDITAVPETSTHIFSPLVSELQNNLAYRSSIVLTGTDHLSLVMGSSTLLWSGWIFNLSQLFNQTPGFNIKRRHAHFAYQSSLLYLSPPTRVYKYEYEDPSHGPALSWILEQDPIVRQLARQHDSRIVYLHAGRIAGQAINMKLMSQQLYTAYDIQKDPNSVYRPEIGCFYFEFDKHDIRRASIKDMIVSFLIIFAGRFWSKSADSYLVSSAAYMRRFRSWSTRHLINVFLDVQKAPAMQAITVILGGLDNCEEKERFAFTQAVLDRQDRSEIPFNLIITTREPDDFLCDHLPPANIINLEDCPLSVEDYLTCPGPLVTEDRIKCLLARRPELTQFGLELYQIFSKLGAVPTLQETMLDGFSNYQCDSLAEITDKIRKRACSPHQELWSGIVNQLPTTEQRIAMHIYGWIKYAAEPLTLEILVESVKYTLPREMAQLKQMWNYGDFSSFLERVMGGIILRDGHDFKFSDDAFYNVSASTEVDAERDQAHRSHASMAATCLHYLLGTEGQGMLTSLSVEKQGMGDLGWSLVTLPRHSLVSYALRFWTFHYRAAGDYRPTQLASELLQNGLKKAAWAEALYVASNPFTRMEREYVSSLPYMAMFGLDDLVRSHIENEEARNSRNYDHWLAIAEAALNGHGSTVALLLDHTDTDAAGLGEALTCAARYGEGEALDILISRAQQLECFSWPRGILAHAVTAGLENLVSALAQAGHDLDEAGYDYPLDEEHSKRDWRAVHLAIEFGQDRLLKILLETGRVDLGLEDSSGQSALVLATKLGTAASIRQLLDAGADLATQDPRDIQALLYNTISYGNYKALEMLIAAKVYSSHLLTHSIHDSSTGISSTALSQAAKLGFSQCTRILLDNGVDPNAVTESGSALWHAIVSGPHIEICRSLLDKGASPEYLPDKETSPEYLDLEPEDTMLTRAIKIGNKLLVEVLLDYGAQMIVGDGGFPRNALACAVHNDQYEIMELLLKRDANPNPVPEGQGTVWLLETCSPLFVAAHDRRDTRFMKTLIDHGANVNWRSARREGWAAMSTEGLSVLHMAVKEQSKESVQLLLEQTDSKVDLELASTDSFRKTALCVACEGDDAAIRELLLDAGADINHTRSDGMSPLMILFASHEGLREDDVAMMLKRGAKLDQVTDRQCTILHGIDSATQLPAVMRLVEEGAPVNTVNDCGETPLAIALRRGNWRVARYLTTVKGVRSDICHPTCGSILHIAAETTTLEMVKQLVRTGAEPSVVDPGYKKSASVLYSAIENIDETERWKIVRYLVEELGVDVNAFGGSVGRPLHLALVDRKQKGSALMKYLLRHGADPDQSDSFGRTASHWAVMCSDFDALKILGKFGADFSKPDMFGRTPIHFAAVEENTEIIAYIVERVPKDVDIINIVDVDGWTPLMWACKTHRSYFYRFGLGLINDYKADARIRSKDGQWSALKLLSSNLRELSCYRVDHALEYIDDMAKCCETQGVEQSLIERDREPESPLVNDDDNHVYPTCHYCRTECTRCGPTLMCRQCNLYLCFKCSPHAGEMHDQRHTMIDPYEPFYADEGSDLDAEPFVHESESGVETETEEEETESETEDEEEEEEDSE